MKDLKHLYEFENLLPEANELSKIFEPFFNIDIIISDSEMYQVSGTKK